MTFPMIRLRTLHLIIGIAGLLAFVLSGQYMHHFLDHLQGMPDGARLMYRSAHLYLFWASLLNLLLGSYLDCATQGGIRRFQILASAMIVLAPFLIGFSFFVESNSTELFRPFARVGIYSALAGCIIHAFVASAMRRQNGSR